MAEWDALPYWHKAAYRKCLADEFGRREGQQEQPTAPVGAISDEGIAALEARGVRVIRKG